MHYTGPERRKSTVDRRAYECIWHEAHTQRFLDDERDIAESKRCVNKLKVEIGTKVPMKMFYTLVGLIIVILGVQWRTYQQVNEIALDHSKAMGSINTSIAEIKSEVTHGNVINSAARATIKEALIETNKDTNEKFKNIQRTIEKFHKD